MSNSRTTAPAKDQAHTSLARHTFISGVATFLAHPLRILLNRATVHPDPYNTIRDALPRLTRGIANNFVRGTLAASSQSYAKMVGQQHGGFVAGISASAICGTIVGVFVETRLIRTINLTPAIINAHSLWRFSVPLASLYFMREVGFSLSVLAKNDLPPTAQNAALIVASGLTASIHKLAATEAIRDMLPSHITAPDIRDGIGKTIRALANGNVYTHPAFQVKIKNPTTLYAKTCNLFNAACGWNMFAFRLIYLFGFREAYHYAARTPTTAAGWAGLFSHHDTKNEPVISPTPLPSSPGRKN